MIRLSPILISLPNYGLLYRCPGCNTNHLVYYQGSTERVRWTWNNDVLKPSLSPSILVRDKVLSPLGIEQYTEWVNNHFKSVDTIFDTTDILCHSFMESGHLRFLNDCTHELKGQTVPMPWINGLRKDHKY